MKVSIDKDLEPQNVSYVSIAKNVKRFIFTLSPKAPDVQCISFYVKWEAVDWIQDMIKNKWNGCIINLNGRCKSSYWYICHFLVCMNYKKKIKADEPVKTFKMATVTHIVIIIEQEIILLILYYII